ncbi:MAG: SRPBCC domain-containing protein [Alphaproteobacteria bacterium]|nr:SRPBCC domain-containing protein [Alphaproteobacteria bacterium]
MNVVAKPVDLVLKRDLAAPREQVFAAWTDIAKATRWWVPHDFTIVACEMDVRPGGIWQRRLRAPDGRVIVKHGVYREVVRPERLVFTYNTEGNGIDDPETLVTVTFADLGGRTRLTLRHTAFLTEASRLDHEGGWTGALDRVVAYFAD